MSVEDYCRCAMVTVQKTCGFVFFFITCTLRRQLSYQIPEEEQEKSHWKKLFSYLDLITLLRSGKK